MTPASLLILVLTVLVIGLGYRKYRFIERDDPDGWLGSAIGIGWNKKADEVSQSSLLNVSAVAEKWLSQIGAFLGVLSAVAIVEGPKTFEEIRKLDEAAGQKALYLLLSAAALSALSFFLAALAAHGTPRWMRRLTGYNLMRWQHRRARIAIWELAASRTFAALTAIAIFAAMSAAWLPTTKQKAEPPELARVILLDDGVLCGELTRVSLAGETENVVALKESDGSLRLLRNVQEIQEVKKCP